MSIRGTRNNGKSKTSRNCYQKKQTDQIACLVKILNVRSQSNQKSSFQFSFVDVII